MLKHPIEEIDKLQYNLIHLTNTGVFIELFGLVSLKSHKGVSNSFVLNW